MYCQYMVAENSFYFFNKYQQCFLINVKLSSSRCNAYIVSFVAILNPELILIVIFNKITF